MSVTPSSERSTSARAASSAPQLVTPSLLVSLAATPCLLAIVAIRATSEVLERIGVTSEEIFRGDRLPVIHFPSEDP
jgi:hypothetical protein